MYLLKNQITALLNEDKPENKLYIRPLLDNSQIGELSVDFRLGTDFLLTSFGREVSIDSTNDNESRPISSFFSPSRRLLGETFIFHPHQTVLCSTLEYIKLPQNIFLTLTTRSSYSRIGFHLSTLVHPGFCGCISIELTNSSNIPVKLLVGARILQATFHKIDQDIPYFSDTERKYSCQVRPEISKANEDSEFEKIKSLFIRNPS